MLKVREIPSCFWNRRAIPPPKTGHPAAKDYAAALKADGIPVTQFLSADVETEYKELSDKGVKFTMEPTDVGPSIIAVFDDTVGNLIQLVELKK